MPGAHLWLVRRPHARNGVEHLGYPFGADLGPRHHHEHERRHDHRHQDLHEIAEEGCQGADLHVPIGNSMTTHPHHGHAGDVHDEHHHGKHQHHQAPHADGDVHQVGAGTIEPLLFVSVLDEGPDDTDTADLLPQDPVYQVDLLLHRPEQRPHPGDDQHHAHQEGRDDHHQQRGQIDVLAQSHDDAAEAHDRRRNHHREGQQHHHLHLLDVVGGSGDQ